MLQIIGPVTAVLCALSAEAADPSFGVSSPPSGWLVTGNRSQDATGITPEDRQQIEMKTTEPINLPVECTFRLHLPNPGASLHLEAAQDGQEEPLLFVALNRQPGNELNITALASGKNMATVTKSSRPWDKVFENTGTVNYGWRFSRVANLWDERDRAEIGSDYGGLTPFSHKVFVVRMVIAPEMRQLWIDDRLVAEQRIETHGPVNLAMKLMPGSVVLSVDVKKSVDYSHFLPIHLDDYESDGQLRPSKPIEYIKVLPDVSVPVQMIGEQTREIDLGNSLFRYRLTHGAGPDTPYVYGPSAWPNPLRIDPSIASFRVPYRDYQNAWLVAWIDNEPDAVPRGTFCFYRDSAGYPAQTDFEISKDAIAKGLVKPLDLRTTQGNNLYLIKVPIDSGDFYGFADMADEFIDFQVTKPVYLLRSYPDPIYYGYHPGGPPSSIHIAGITFEESPFGYQVKPHQYGHVFEQPEKPEYTLLITNHSNRILQAKVRVDTSSYDGMEKNKGMDSISIEAGQTAQVVLDLNNVRTLGWHEMKVTVEGDGVVRSNTLSLVLLPPNRRTYGNDANETRFGMWNLLGHYVPLTVDKFANEPILAMFRKLGLRRIGWHSSFIDPETALKYNLLPGGPHTLYYHAGGVDENDPQKWQKMLEDEFNVYLGPILKFWPTPTYYYGGEWGIEHPFTHVANPRYTGKGPFQFSETGIKKLNRDMKIFTAIGNMLREKAPGANLILQWGGEMDTIPFLEHGFPKDLVDGYGLDMPMFEQTPEIPVAIGTVNRLWAFRQEVKRLGWPQLGVYWVEGPFLPTNDGALTEREQEQNYIRHWLLGLSYGIESFESGVVPHDAGNYYGDEHYGAGVFHRLPLENPKPVVAAIATATTMLCGADFVGPVDTGVPTTYCMGFTQSGSGRKIYALWRVCGSINATLIVNGEGPAIVTDAMGNPRTIAIKDNKLSVSLSPSVIWLTGLDEIKEFKFGSPTYETAPAPIARPLPAFIPDNWTYDGSPVNSYENNHFSVARVTDKQLRVTFEAGVAGAPGHGEAACITLPVQPAGDRPLAARYGTLVLKEPAVIKGKANALGIWVKGNSSWGRVAFQLRDANGEVWTSIGTKDDWNCDDTHTWSFVNFEDWRYMNFPLPGNHPYDMARELETTWWKSEEGDGIVDLPLRLERIFVETRNEVHYLGNMHLVTDRTYKIAGLIAEYDSIKHAKDEILTLYRLRRQTPKWQGPAENPIARMRDENTGEAPLIKGFEEPPHWNDGRQMLIRFDENEGYLYNLYLSRYADGRGAERLSGQYKDTQMVSGLRPGIEMYFFLTAIGPDGKESRPSETFRLVTEDKFLEK
ncbi:MAG: hypothetical protein HY663_05160 [Chloroflexi bacterium]|nr:hypothetical protein [Chloroflexota bacterium]